MAVKWRFFDKSEYESVWEMFSRLIWIQIHIDGHLVAHAPGGYSVFTGLLDCMEGYAGFHQGYGCYGCCRYVLRVKIRVLGNQPDITRTIRSS